MTAVEWLSQELEKGIRGGDAWLDYLNKPKKWRSNR